MKLRVDCEYNEKCDMDEFKGLVNERTRPIQNIYGLFKKIICNYSPPSSRALIPS